MTDTVAQRTEAVSAMVQAAAKGRALMGGTDAMRSKGETYLPKFPSESDEAYKARKNSTFLFNGYKKTVRDMTGKVFDKPVELTEGAPAKLKAWCENADLQGRDLSAFAKDVFKKGYDAGISYIMVDAPRREGEVTQAQAERQNLRPYLVHLTVEDVLGWKTAVIGNVTVLSQLRIMETVQKDDPEDEFKSASLQQVRVLDRAPDGVTVRLFRQNEKKEWAEAERYKSAAKEITVIPFYAERTGFFIGEPVLEDLADVNIAHWQSQSDQRNILHSARVPILFAAGRDDEAPLVISAGSATTSRNPNARLEWIEHSGAAIESGRQDLKDLEFQMEALGLQLLVARAQSATGEALDAAKETSQLSMMADSLKDALEQAMVWMGFYGGLGDTGAAVSVNKDFGVSLLTAQELTAMIAAVNNGHMSRETFLEEMKRRGFVRADLDTEAELDRLSETVPDLQGAKLSLGDAT